MPRLHVWFALGVSLSSSFYGFYYHYHLPRQTVDKETAALLSTEKLGVQRVMQQIHHIASMRIPVTNKEREKLLVYTQTAKLELIRAEKGISTMSRLEVTRLWNDLTRIEGQNCTCLAFREQALSAAEQLHGAVAWVLYVALFGIFFPLSRMVATAFVNCASTANSSNDCRLSVEVVEASVVVAQHHAAMWILDSLLHTKVTAKSAGGVFSVAEAAASLLDEAVAEVEGDADLTQRTEEVRVLAFAPSSWVEELAFYAAQRNPLVQQSAEILDALERRNSPDAPEEEKLRKRRLVRYTLNGFVGASPAATAPSAIVSPSPASLSSITNRDFAASLRRRSKASRSTESEDASELGESGVDVKEFRTLLGYPVVSCTFPLSVLSTGSVDASRIKMVPVVSRGLPSCLFVSDAVAMSAERSRSGDKERFEDVISLQYERRGAAPRASTSSSPQVEEKVPCSLPSAVLRSHLPLCAPAAVTGVGGGCIEIYFGEPVTALSNDEAVDAILATYRGLVYSS
jgi:hypothetical protein